MNIVLIIIIRLTETASDLRTPRLSYDGSLTSGVTVNASGLPVWPADIQIKDIQAKTSCAVHQSFYSPISNLRHENGVERGCLQPDIHPRMNTDR